MGHCCFRHPLQGRYFGQRGIYGQGVQFSSSVPGYQDIHGNIVPETPVDPSVFLDIYKNGTLLKEIVLNPLSEAYIDPDYEVKVTTDKNSYTSYSDLIIIAKIEVKNSGAFAKNVDVNLNTGELKIRSGDVSDHHRYYQRTEKDTMQQMAEGRYFQHTIK